MVRLHTLSQWSMVHEKAGFDKHLRLSSGMELCAPVERLKINFPKAKEVLTSITITF